MEWFLFVTAVLFELIYVLMFVLTIKLPQFRFWPPPSPRSWQFFSAWLMAGIVVVNGIILGLLNFDSAFLPSLPERMPIVLIFVVFGSAIGTWSYTVYGLRATLGLGDKLIVNGPYRYTRNPQYIGDSINAVGYMLLTNSWMVWVIGILGILLNMLAPYTEEPWLEKRYGEIYLKYKENVPRFFGRKGKSRAA
jgi:protein-S-isoprenylcysteine O-methyltransferase Ste14